MRSTSASSVVEDEAASTRTRETLPSACSSSDIREVTFVNAERVDVRRGQHRLMRPAAIVLLVILGFGCGQDESPTPSLSACGSLEAADCQAAMTAARLAQELDGAVIQAI